MRVCFVVNGIRTQKPTYTTVQLALAAARHGHEVAFAAVDGLTRNGDLVSGRLVRPVGEQCTRTSEDFVESLRRAEPRDEPMGEFDVAWLRANPNAATEAGGFINPAVEFGHCLRQAGVMVWNDPAGLLRAGSKLYLAGFPKALRPRTLVTRSFDRVRAFLRDLDGPAVIKPLEGYGGTNVFFVGRGERVNLAQIVATVQADGYLIVQEYLPAAARGDKRILLLAGVPIQVDGHFAAYLRMRPKGDMRNNMHIGGARRACSLTAAELHLCEQLRPRLVADGLYLVGVDLVGEKILEVNVFAPGGIHNINELYGIDVGAEISRDLERKLALKRAFKSPLPSTVLMQA